jgi:hypothetical protein
LFRKILPHRHAPAEQIRRVERLEHNIGVGHRRLDVAAPVADRSRISTGAARPDFQEAAAVDKRNRSAACSNGVDVEHWGLHGVAMHGCL